VNGYDQGAYRYRRCNLHEVLNKATLWHSAMKYIPIFLATNIDSAAKCLVTFLIYCMATKLMNSGERGRDAWY